MNKLEQEVFDLLKENDNFIDDVEEFEIIKEGDWISEHKYEHKEIIIKYKEFYFRIDRTRCGSYHTDYDYNEPEITQVKPKDKVKTIRTWVPVE